MAKTNNPPRQLGSHWIHSIKVDRVGPEDSMPDSTKAGVIITIEGESQDAGEFLGTFGMNEETWQNFVNSIRTGG
jgi:hypothetical protein